MAESASGKDLVALTSLALRALTTAALLAAALLTPSRAGAQPEVDPAATGHPVLPAVYVSTPPVIDGLLDDPAWWQATALDGFYVPGTEPNHMRTDVFLRINQKKEIVWKP